MIKSVKDYESICPWPIENIPPVFKWLLDSFRENQTLLQYNKDNFKQLWGRQTFCYTTYRRFWCWVRPIDNFEIVVMTHCDKGTVFEVSESTLKLENSNKIISFLTELRTQLYAEAI